MSTSDPGRRRTLTTLRAGVARHKTAAVMTAVVGVSVTVGGGLALAGDDAATPRHRAATGQERLLAPGDGPLRVAGQRIPQMAGACDGSSCYRVPSARPVQIDAGDRATLPLAAGESALFSVGAFDLDQPTAAFTIGLRGNALVLDQVPAGRYQVTVEGRPNGGMWQFHLTVGDKPTR